MWGRIWQIVLKEFIELRRDRMARFRLIVPPLIQMLLFGYAASFDVYHVSTGILDLDRTQETRELISRFSFSDRFSIVRMESTQKAIEDDVERGTVTAALVIHPGFSEALRKGQADDPAQLQVLLDGTNSNTALIALGYIDTVAAAFAQDYAVDYADRVRGADARAIQINLMPRPWYNDGLDGRWFFVPGVIGTITLIMVVNLTAFAIVREREVGTLEQIMVTPIRPFELIIGKTIPFYFVGLALVAGIAAFGIGWFQIPFVGNPLVLFLGTSLFLLSALGIGLAISTVCRTQQQAFATNFFVLNPLFILSGFSFPIASMPQALQWLTYLNPLRYFLIVIRATFLKGVGLAVLWPQMAGLSVLACLFLGISVLRFRKSLD